MAQGTLVVVRCEDGKVRHAAPFTSRREAYRWAEWGHACTRRHTLHTYGASSAYMLTMREDMGQDK